MGSVQEFTEFVTEDGVRLRIGDPVYNYYDMEPGITDPKWPASVYAEEGESPDPKRDLWFHFQQDNGEGGAILNGERMCSLEYARRHGFPGAAEALSLHNAVCTVIES